jgi:WD40 repeat protein
MDQFDLAEGNDTAWSVACGGNKIFVVGQGRNELGYHNPVIRSYNAKKGDLIWSNHSQLGSLTSIVFEEKVVVVGGSIEGDILVRALDSDTGSLIWEDQFDFAQENDTVDKLAIEGGRVFAAGYVRTSDDMHDFAVRAYDSQNGNLLWADYYGRAGGIDTAQDIVASKGRVYVAGGAYNSSGDRDFLVRVYDAKTGNLLWMDLYGTTGGEDAALGIAITSGRVYVSGVAYNSSDNLDFLVRVYDAQTGDLLWMNQYDYAAGADIAGDVSSGPKGVYVVGWGTSGLSNRIFIVRAHDPITGSLLWMDEYDSLGGSYTDEAHCVQEKAGQLYVSGRGHDPGGGHNFLVRTYDAQTGDLLWMDLDIPAGGHAAYRLAIKGSQLYVVGATGGDFLIRVYDAK